MADEMMNRLMLYANAIIGNKKICDNQAETMKRIVENQPEIIFEAMGIDIEPKQAESDPKKRIMKYYELLNKVPVESAKIRQTDRISAYAKQIESIIKAYSKYDYSKEGKIEVNGNTFTYNKDKLDPSKYIDEMAKMGESVKGDLFSVSLDEDGKVVIY